MPCQACKEFKEKHVRYKTAPTPLDDPWDYTQDCIVGGSCNCSVGNECATAANCRSGNCGCSCGAPSKPNSHLETNGCSSVMTGCACRSPGYLCSGINCACVCNGLCYYHCDPGYVWNPVTLQCDLIPVVSEPIMDGFMYID